MACRQKSVLPGIDGARLQGEPQKPRPAATGPLTLDLIRNTALSPAVRRGTAGAAEVTTLQPSERNAHGAGRISSCAAAGLRNASARLNTDRCSGRPSAA